MAEHVIAASSIEAKDQIGMNKGAVPKVTCDVTERGRPFLFLKVTLVSQVAPVAISSAFSSSFIRKNSLPYSPCG
jgi:hypothetical protein